MKIIAPEKTENLETPKENCHVIVIGNEKGGAGKTTTSMHLIVSLLELGFKVSTLDLDVRQRSLSRYLENRFKTSSNNEIPLSMPNHYVIVESQKNNFEEKEAEERQNFLEIFSDACKTSDFVVIDTPGSNSFLSRMAHSHADTIITPINDSFLDLDVLANVEAETLKIIKPTFYAQTIWEQKMEKAKKDPKKPVHAQIDWIVVRNRLSNLDAKNKQKVQKVLEELSKKVGFRLGHGFSERVIFRELFLEGLTVLDLEKDGVRSKNLGISEIAARQELRNFIKFLGIKKINNSLVNSKEEEIA